MMTPGCGSDWRVYDPQALGAARKLLVLPAVGAPGQEGPNAGPVETGLLITALGNTGSFEVEGPGRLRKAATAASSEGAALWSPSVQAELTEQLDADLLVLCEVIDYRATTKQCHRDYYFGQSDWTETVCWAGVNLRFLKPGDGRLVYFGTGSASSQTGFGPALRDATDMALTGMKQFLANNPARFGTPVKGVGQ